jgi:3-deoxy-D-manno-octulosonic-acid transferase
MRLFLLGYALLWAVALPLVLLYLLWRSRRDPLYRRYIGERFGIYPAHSGETVWVHAVSLGETAAKRCGCMRCRWERCVLPDR